MTLNKNFWCGTIYKLDRIAMVSGFNMLYELAEEIETSCRCIFESEQYLLQMLTDMTLNCVRCIDVWDDFSEIDAQAGFIALGLLKDELKKADTCPKVRKK